MASTAKGKATAVSRKREEYAKTNNGRHPNGTRIRKGSLQPGQWVTHCCALDGTCEFHVQGSYHVKATGWVVTTWCAHSCDWLLDDYHQAQDIKRLSAKLKTYRAKLEALNSKPAADVNPGTKETLERNVHTTEALLNELGPQRLNDGYPITFRPYSISQMGKALQHYYEPGQPTPDRKVLVKEVEARMDANSVDAQIVRGAIEKAKGFATQEWETDLQQLPKVVEALRKAGHQVRLFTSPPSEVRAPLVLVGCVSGWCLSPLVGCVPAAWHPW